MTRALLITNPAAARTAARAVTTVRETLRGGGWALDVVATHGRGDARRLAEEARTRGFDVVVCYGGDGTAMEIAGALVGSEIALGLVPGGTGNLLAGNLRVPRTPAAAARALLAARPVPVDLGVVERGDGTHYFAVAAGAGFDAELMAGTAAAAKQRWKMGAYVARALETLHRVRSVPHRITVDGRASEVEAAMVLVANCGEMIPPFLRLRPDIEPDDGWLDVVTLRADGMVESVAAFLALMRGAAESGVTSGTGNARVWVARGRTVRVEALGDGTRPVQLDGDAAGTTPFEARIVPGAVRVLVDPGRRPRA